MESVRKWKCICRWSSGLIPLFLITVFLFDLWTFSNAQVLDINSAIEPRLYQGTPEQIEEFIKNRQYQISQIISQLSSIPKENLSNKDKQALLDALELLEGLSFQFARLKRMIKAPGYSLISIPSLGSPPYKLIDLDKSLSTYHQLIQKLNEYQKQSRVLLTDLSNIEQELKQIFMQYLDLKKDPSKKIKAYSTMAQLMSLQVEYALKMCKKSKLTAAIQKLIPLISEYKKRISKIFNNLTIDYKDIKDVKEKKQKIEKQQEILKKKIILNQRIINKNIFLFDLRLDNLIHKLGSSQISEVGKRLLNVEKARIEARLNRLQYRKEFLNQENIALSLQEMFIEFKNDWVTNYSGYTGHKKTGIIIRDWHKKTEDLSNEINQLKEKLDQIRFNISILNEKMVRISKEIDIEKDPQVKDSLNSLYRELRENKKYLDKLLDKISNNLAYAKTVLWNIKDILCLLQNRMSPIERLSYKLKGNFQNVWLSIKGIIYYPLWSMGGNVITIMTILKIIFSLCLGIYLLRLIKSKLSKFLIERFGLSVGLVNSISTLSYYFMLLLVIFIALSTAGVNLSQITIILGALGVGIGFGLQTIANNFISGLILLTERTIKVGDIVELENGLIGTVKDVSIRSTVIRTYDGLDMIIPNSEFISNKVSTWTYGDDWRRLKIHFGVSYNSDPAKVRQIAIEVARKIPITIEDKEHPVTVWFEGFGDNSIDFCLLVWCRMGNLPKSVTGLKSDYYFELFKKFQEEGIEIPFPQRDIHIKSISQDISHIIKKE